MVSKMTNRIYEVLETGQVIVYTHTVISKTRPFTFTNSFITLYMKGNTRKSIIGAL